jgi:hypothetical protein
LGALAQALAIQIADVYETISELQIGSDQRVFHIEWRLAHVQNDLPWKSSALLLAVNRQRVFRHAQRHGVIRAGLQVNLDQNSIGRLTEQIDPSVNQFRYFDVQPARNRCAGQFVKHQFRRPSQKQLQDDIVFLCHRIFSIVRDSSVVMVVVIDNESSGSPLSSICGI